MFTLILDVGKTNIKSHVMDDRGESVWSRSHPNAVQQIGDYPSIDVDETWLWFQETLRTAAQLYSIAAINVSTHGACAVLLSRSGDLLFPVMDYEVQQLEIDGESYSEVRPDYEHTLSPDLPGGLNLGRQIWWLRLRYPERFGQLSKILLYPQYWVWKLTGLEVSEVTSLGCHTDLWEPLNRHYSSLVGALGIENKLAPLVESHLPVGRVRTDLASELGLPDSCTVYPGVHDSNGSLARYLVSGIAAPFTVISTGTWVVVMAVGNACDRLREAQDMLANVDVRGKPVACARFMGGREFETICDMTGAGMDDNVTEADLQAIVDQQVFAVPPIEPGSGPFRDSQQSRRLSGTTTAGKSLATLYLALMIDYELDLLNSSGPGLLGSTSLKNPMLCQLLAQLRPDQSIVMSNDHASTIKGTWCLTRWQRTPPSDFSEFEVATGSQIEGLMRYRDQWRALAEGRKNAYEELQ